MNHDWILQQGDQAVSYALKRGADEVEVYLSQTQQYGVSMEANQIKLATSSQEDGVGIRIIKKHSIGFASLNTFNEQEIQKKIDAALETASISPSADWNRLPDPIPIPTLEGLTDPQFIHINLDKIANHVQTMLHSVLEVDDRISIDGGGIEAEADLSAVVSSKGIRHATQRTLFESSLMGLAKTETEVSGLQYTFKGSHFWDSLNPKEQGRTLAHRILATLGARKLEHGFEGLVLLSPEAVNDIFLSVIEYGMNAENVQQGTSAFHDKRGKRIAPSLLTIIDNGIHPDGLDSNEIDREGIPHQPLTLCEEGIAQQFYYNSKTAFKDATHSTGHAAGDHQSLPTSALTNIEVAPGATSYEDILKQIDEGILVTRIAGSPNRVTGDFSGVVKGGFYIKNGNIQYPIIETMLSGNAFSLLSKIMAVSIERETIWNTTSPYLLVDNAYITRG